MLAIASPSMSESLANTLFGTTINAVSSPVVGRPLPRTPGQRQATVIHTIALLVA